jgi:hypothetical protein
MPWMMQLLATDRSTKNTTRALIVPMLILEDCVLVGEKEEYELAGKSEAPELFSPLGRGSLSCATLYPYFGGKRLLRNFRQVGLHQHPQSRTA